MTDTINRIKNDFQIEVTNESDFWRIFKGRTLMDLVNVGLSKYHKEHNKSDLIEIINLLIKVKILMTLGEMDISGTLDDLLKRINEQKEQIIKLYDEILAKIIFKLDFYKGKEFDNKMYYFKVTNEFNIDNYSEEMLDEIICVAINTLNDSEVS